MTASAPVAGPGGGRLLPPWDRRRATLLAVSIGLLVLTILSLRVTEISVGDFLEGLEAVLDDDTTRQPDALLRRMLAMQPGEHLWNPVDLASSLWRIVVGDFELGGQISGAEILSLAFETIWIAVLGTGMAVALSVPIALMAASNTAPNRFVRQGARAVIVGSRAIPDLVFAIIFVRALGLGVLPGVLAIGLHAIGMLGKLFADAIEEIDEGIREAVEATGAGRLQTVVSSVVPQLMPTFVSVSLYRLDINFRGSVVLGFVGAGGIGQLLNATFNNLRYQDALRIVLVIMALVLLVEWLSSSMRVALLGDDDGLPRRRTLAALGAPVRAVGRMGRSPQVEAQPNDDLHDDVDSEFARLLRGQVSSPPPELRRFDRKAVLPPWTPARRRRVLFGLVLAAMVVVAVVSTGLWPWKLATGIWGILTATAPSGQPYVAAFVPDFPKAIAAGAIGDMVETVAIGLAATGFGLLVAVPAAFLAARNAAPNGVVAGFFRYVLVVQRSIPELVYAIIFVAAVGLGPFAGVMALVLLTIGFVAKLMADAIEEVDDGPREAVQTTGASRLQERVAAVLPQVTPNLIGNSLYMLDVNIRASTVLGIVGGGGIGFLLNNSVKVLEFGVTSAIIVVVFVVVFAIERLSNAVRAQLI